MSQITAESYNRQMDVASRIHAAAGAPLPADRDAIRKALADAEQAQITRRQAESDIADLEAKLEQLVAEHQVQARRIHEQIAASRDGEERLRLRQELGTFNQSLQRQCDGVNDSIASATQTRDDAYVAEGQITRLRNALAQSGDKSIQMAIEVAANTVRWSTERLKVAEKKLSELESMVGTPAPQAPTKWQQPAKPRNYSDADLARLKYRHEIATLEHTTAAAMQAEAEIDLASLRTELLS